MCGFRKHSEILGFVRCVPELKRVIFGPDSEPESENVDRGAGCDTNWHLDCFRNGVKLDFMLSRAICQGNSIELCLSQPRGLYLQF